MNQFNPLNPNQFMEANNNMQGFQNQGMMNQNCGCQKQEMPACGCNQEMPACGCKRPKCPTTFTCCPPIVTCSKQVVDQYHIVRQPYVHNYHTEVVHHHVYEKEFIPKYSCSEVHVNDNCYPNQPF